MRHRLRLNEQRAARNNKDPHSGLLRGGFAKCGHCGGTMTPKAVGAKKHYRQYRCIRGMLTPRCDGASIPVHNLDRAAWERVEAILTRPGVVAAELERLRAHDPTATDLATLDRALAGVERQQRNLVDQLAELDPDATAPVRVKLTELGARRRQLAAEREEILSRREAWQAARDRVNELEAWCRAVGSNLSGFDYGERRLALDALGMQVRVWREQHEPRYEITASIPLGGATLDRSPRRSGGRRRVPTCAARPAPG